MKKLPKLAIIGRPNVGKSTLFNRLIGRRMALVHNRPGVTRDRREAEGSLGNLDFTVIDTAGLADPEGSSLTELMMEQSEQAIVEADVVLFVIDGVAGATPHDNDLADALRRSNKPLLLLVNKCEGKQGSQGIADAHCFGMDADVIAISAEHGLGMEELYDALHQYIQPIAEQNDEAQKPLQLAIVGRPNVGKSTLVNALIGEERMITGDMPGVTRDSISVDWHYENRPIKLVDTAGMRKRARLSDAVEKLSVQDARNTIRFAEVVVLVLDASCALEKQDLTLASQVEKEGRSLVIAVNKADLIRDKNSYLNDLKHQTSRHLSQMQDIPIVLISATKKNNLDKMMQVVFDMHELWNARISTGELNRWLSYQVEAHPPPAVKGRRIKLKYMTQAKTCPPTFALFCSQATELPASYVRYLTNRLRNDFNMPGVPIRMYAKSSNNPYA